MDVKFTDDEAKESSKNLECPICFDKFDEIDNVIQLRCSQFHIYHYQCMESMLKSNRGMRRNCALCRTPILINDNSRFLQKVRLQEKSCLSVKICGVDV